MYTNVLISSAVSSNTAYLPFIVTTFADDTSAQFCLQLDWRLMSSQAYAGLWAADVRFQFQVQICNPDEKLHRHLSMLVW